MNKTGYPEPVVGTFIVNNENKLFLMKSKKWSDLWVVPGGHIEVGETIEHALKREAKEETNIDIVHPTFICLWEFIQEEQYHDLRHMLFLNYRVEATSQDVKLNNEGQEYTWASRDEALKLPLEKYTKITIEKYAEKIFTPQSTQEV